MMATYPATRKPARKVLTPAQQLANAIKNAQANGVHVLGQGTMKADGAHFWIVPSQSVEGMCHVVKKTAEGLSCDCYYSAQRGRVCAHRAAVYLHLRAAAEAAKPAPKATAAPAPKIPAPTMAQRAAQALPADRTPEAFSIFADSGRSMRDQAAEAPSYTPRDYVSHQYR